MRASGGFDWPYGRCGSPAVSRRFPSGASRVTGGEWPEFFVTWTVVRGLSWPAPIVHWAAYAALDKDNPKSPDRSRR
jgi:hypothetical protein